MNIKSNKDRIPPNQIMSLDFFKTCIKSPYIITLIIALTVVILSLLVGVSWGIGLIILGIVLLVCTLFINVNLGFYVDLDWNKYWTTIILILIMFIPLIWFPMLTDYKSVERVNENLELNVTTKVYYNDGNQIFILFVGDTNKPLTIDRSDNSDSYNELKAGLLGNDFKVVKKKVRNWYDNETAVGYYLNGYKFD